VNRAALVSALILALALPVVAGELVIPAVYRGAGSHDTLWRTEIVVSNISDRRVDVVPVTITLHREDGTSSDVRIPLSRMEVLAVPDAVHGWFGVEQGGGLVRVRWDDANARIAARARIYNVGQAGEYGQSVPARDTAALTSDHFLAGLTGIDGNRTNVGVANPSASDAFIFISLFDTAGLERGGFATIIPARSVRQFNDIFGHFQAGPLNAAMVHVHSSNTGVYAYASIVRNDTGDATFVTSP
jgi:hypothetical protein